FQAMDGFTFRVPEATATGFGATSVYVVTQPPSASVAMRTRRLRTNVTSLKLLAKREAHHRRVRRRRIQLQVTRERAPTFLGVAGLELRVAVRPVRLRGRVGKLHGRSVRIGGARAVAVLVA